jgi:biopolymer transport protein ExbD
MAASVFAASRPAQGAIAGINITPLVDVMLVLLVIFMVTMPIRSDALSLDLPRTNPNPPPSKAEPVQLQVQADGSVLLDGARVELASLAAELRAQHAQAPDAVLSLDSNGDAEYRSFALALAAARNAGYRDIAIRR